MVRSSSIEFCSSSVFVLFPAVYGVRLCVAMPSGPGQRRDFILICFATPERSDFVFCFLLSESGTFADS